MLFDDDINPNQDGGADEAVTADDTMDDLDEDGTEAPQV
jgi:hypothetical protein